MDRCRFIRKIRKASLDAISTTMDLSGKFGGLSWMPCVSLWDVFGSSNVLEYCAYLDGVPLVFHLWAFTSDGSSGPSMLGLRVVYPVWSISRVQDLGGTFDDLLFHLLLLFRGMCFYSWASFLEMTHSRLVLI